MSRKYRGNSYIAGLPKEERIDCYEKMIAFYNGVVNAYGRRYDKLQLTRFKALLTKEKEA